MAETARPQLVEPRPDGAEPAPALPAEIAPAEGALAALPGSATMPIGLRIFFDPLWREACQAAAQSLAKAVGFAPPHLLGKTESCLAVVNLSLTWNLSPYMVAASTYQTPGGKVGYEGKLVQAILEASGRLAGSVKYKHFGDWTKVQRKFRMARSDKGFEYPVPTYKPEDEIGCGVTISCRVKGETEDRSLDFDLVQAWPRNSTLWATDPKTQIQYAGVRRLASTVAPSLLMGVPFDHEEDTFEENLVDVTPPPLAEPRERPRRGRPPGPRNTAPADPPAGEEPPPPGEAVAQETTAQETTSQPAKPPARQVKFDV